ncbi:hypothetical protein AB0D54_31125 [Streptomyces xanthophaeus]|uniref:hypothetical protein n=1 Tax=Streptomyces xanthophaeus TaxID=67385 RepID=UPI003423BEEC
MKERRGNPVPEGGRAGERARHVTRGWTVRTGIQGDGAGIAEPGIRYRQGRAKSIAQPERDGRVKPTGLHAYERLNGYDDKRNGDPVVRPEKATATAAVKCEGSVKCLDANAEVRATYSKSLRADIRTRP